MEIKKRLNIPEYSLSLNPLTAKEIEESAKKRTSLITKEFANGFEFLKNYDKSVTFFGSSRLDETSKYYKAVRSLARTISEQLNYSIVTGGGPGLMEAANRGAYEAGGNSLGITIKLPKEQVLNPYITDHIDFYYFFSRKVCLTFSAEAYIFCPGGFGTLDEMFEVLTLLQTKKIPPVPVILFGSDFWKPIDDLITNHLIKKNQTVASQDRNIYVITDDEQEVVQAIRKSPVTNGVRYHYGSAYKSMHQSENKPLHKI